MNFNVGERVWARVVSVDLKDRWLPGQILERVLHMYYIVRIDGPVPLNPALVRAECLLHPRQAQLVPVPVRAV